MMSMRCTPHSRRTILMAGMALAFSAAASRARAEAAAPSQAEPPSAPPPAQAEPPSPTPTPPAQPEPPPATPPAPTPPAANLPAPKPTATARMPATVFVERPSAGNDAVLDLSVRAFRPPWRGAVEARVSLKESKEGKEGGREVEVGSFTIFPAKAFEARKPDDERGFRLDAKQALAELGSGTDPVAVKVRLASLRQGRSAAGAKLTLGKVQLIPRAEIK